MQAHQIKFPRTAHYYSLNPPSKHTQQLLLVLHGYGQLARRFIYKFDQLHPAYWVVAPEGFSRFYWKGVNGAVGASWMTKLDRQVEIEDYSNYLQYLLEHLQQQLPAAVPVTVLGFSQGGATAVRWLHRLQPAVQRLFLWGAGFPTDLGYQEQLDYWKELKPHLVQGKQDEYYSTERHVAQETFLQEQGLSPQRHWYEGGHAIDRQLLKQLLESVP